MMKSAWMMLPLFCVDGELLDVEVGDFDAEIDCHAERLGCVG